MIEEVQPYKGAEPGSVAIALKYLAILDIFDKHRQFIVTASVVKRAKTSLSSEAPIVSKGIKFTGQPIKHDQPATPERTRGSSGA